VGIRFGMSGLHLSLCMIARDEADVIADAIASARGVVDEIIVVDTGSEDDTRSIASRCGARVIEHVWQDDFSEARNCALTAATGDWVLILDADERLEAAHLSQLRELLASAAATAFTFRQHNYVENQNAAGLLSSADAPSPYDRWCGYLLARQTRVFPRLAALRYEGRVHEELTASLQREQIERVDTEIVIHHLGKVRGEHQATRKRELYRRLGEAKLGESQDPQAMFELGIALLEVGEVKPALEQLMAAADQLDEVGPRAKCVAAVSRALCRLDRADDALIYLHEHLAAVATMLPAWEALIDVLRRQERHDRAVEVLHQALPLFPGQLQLWTMLGESYLSLRQFDLAAKSFERWHSLGGASTNSVRSWWLGELAMGVCPDAWRWELVARDAVSARNAATSLAELIGGRQAAAALESAPESVIERFETVVSETTV
jgi:glycosyltransferase involved in cell wall biosynthesis